MTSSDSSDKSRGVALALAVFLGVFGAHRFYVGKVNSGILMACTLGGLGYGISTTASSLARASSATPMGAWCGGGTRT